MNYIKILLAVYFHDDNEQIINTALAMAKKSVLPPIVYYMVRLVMC